MRPLLYIGVARAPSHRDLIGTWSASPSVHPVLDPYAAHTLETSCGMVGALQHLVALAGGWVKRNPHRLLAYDSAAVRALRQK
jgi:hypothetical protein